MRKLKRSTLQKIIFIVVGIVLLFGTAICINYIFVKQVKDSYQLELDLANSSIEENTKMLFVSNQEILRGEQIDKENLVEVSTFTSVAQELYITEEDIGKVAIVDIPGSVPILKNMVSDFVQNDLREEEFNVFYLNTNLNKNDYVDIRILFPNGENFIVLSKKELKNISIQNSNCFMWLDANEIHNISSAIVDAYMNEGTKLYTTKYIEPNVQDASIVTYTPNSNVIDLINKDPNVVNRAKEVLSKEIRSDLVDRLKVFYEGYNGEIRWEESVPIKEVVDENIDGEEEGEFYYVE